MNSQVIDQFVSPVSDFETLSIETWKSIGKQVESLLIRALNDVAFKARLLAEPLPFLQEAGVHLPEGVEVRFVEDLAMPWQIVAAEDSQSVLYSLRLSSGELAKDALERELLGSRVASLYGMYASLRSCDDFFPGLEKVVSLPVTLATLEVSFFRSEGNIHMPLPSNWREQGNAVARLIAQAWLDEEFKARFMENPVPLLEEAGVSIPEGLTVEVVEGLEVPWKIVASADAQGATYSINIPPKPDDIRDDDLATAIVERASRNCLCCI